MLNFLNILNFANLPALLGLFAIPLIFYILRLHPPAPKRFFFSSLFLINKKDKTIIKKNKFPLWLLIFRILLLIFIILFFSKPFINNSLKPLPNNSVNNYIILADIGWSMSHEWEKTKKIINNISSEAEKNNKKITFYHTGLSKKKMPLVFNNSREINLYMQNIQPYPWQINETTLDNIINEKKKLYNNKFFYIFSKLDSKNSIQLINKIEKFNKIFANSIIINPIESIVYIKNLEIEKDYLKLELKRIGLLDLKKSFNIIIKTLEESILFKKSYSFESNIKHIDIKESFPLAILNQMHKLEIANQNHAAAKFYFDDFSKKKRIGILSNNIAYYKESPLLSPIYYLEKSLKPYNLIQIGEISDLIEFNSSVIIIPDKGKIIEKNKPLLNNWINNGGTLVRFSGPMLANSNSSFLPNNNSSLNVRYVGGDLNIENNLSISKFDEKSIFSGLNIFDDIRFNKQLIFNNYSENTEIHAKLNDNTPLVTFAKRGLGKIFLFHVTANNDWSNLPLSSLFANMLNRIILLSEKKHLNTYGNLVLTKEINSFGSLKKTNKMSYVIDHSKLKSVLPSKEYIPGIYENKEITASLNLSSKIQDINLDKNLENKSTIYKDYNNDIIDLSKPLIKIISFMILLDLIITISLKNRFRTFNSLKRNKIFINSILFFLIFINFNNLYSNQLINNTYLAYIKLPDQNLNYLSKNGLNTISKLLTTRTSISPKGVIEVDINEDPIFYFPFLYWPLSNNLIKLSDKSIVKIKNYLHNGGIIFFDVVGFSRDNLNLNDIKFKNIKNFLSEIEGNNLSQISKEHTLTKSFYLLRKFPGKWDNKILLIDNNDLNLKDGVSSIILGFNNWASAWALDTNNNPLYPVIPGGERQRELSYRVGINISVYALTGNYKADQVHTKSILKRLNNSID